MSLASYGPRRRETSNQFPIKKSSLPRRLRLVVPSLLQTLIYERTPTWTQFGERMELRRMMGWMLALRHRLRFARTRVGCSTPFYGLAQRSRRYVLIALPRKIFQSISQWPAFSWPLILRPRTGGLAPQTAADVPQGYATTAPLAPTVAPEVCPHLGMALLVNCRARC
jgi:hypothetical protein